MPLRPLCDSPGVSSDRPLQGGVGALWRGGGVSLVNLEI